MTKTVAKRSWSIEKFSEAVKHACERAGVRFSTAKAKEAYEAGWTVAYAVSRMDAKSASKATTGRVAKKAA